MNGRGLLLEGQGRGYVYLFLSVVLNATGFHAWKFALRDSTPLTVNVLSGIMAACLFFGAGMLWRWLGWRAGRLDGVSVRAVAGCIRRRGLWLILPPAGAALGGWRMPDLRTLGFLAAGAVSCNMLGMTLLYAAYRAIGVSRGAPLDAMRQLAVLAIGLLLGAPVPGAIRILGAGMILGGSVVLTWLNGRRKMCPADRMPASGIPLLQKTAE